MSCVDYCVVLHLRFRAALCTVFCAIGRQMEEGAKRRAYGRRVCGVPSWESQARWWRWIAIYGSPATWPQVARAWSVLSVRLNRPLDVNDIEDVSNLVGGRRTRGRGVYCSNSHLNTMPSVELNPETASTHAEWSPHILLAFLQSQSQTALTRLYQRPSSCLSIFRYA